MKNTLFRSRRGKFRCPLSALREKCLFIQAHQWENNYLSTYLLHATASLFQRIGHLLLNSCCLVYGQEIGTSRYLFSKNGEWLERLPELLTMKCLSNNLEVDITGKCNLFSFLWIKIRVRVWWRDTWGPYPCVNCKSQKGYHRLQ